MNSFQMQYSSSTMSRALDQQLQNRYCKTLNYHKTTSTGHSLFSNSQFSFRMLLHRGLQRKQQEKSFLAIEVHFLVLANTLWRQVASYFIYPNFNLRCKKRDMIKIFTCCAHSFVHATLQNVYVDQ